MKGPSRNKFEYLRERNKYESNHKSVSELRYVSRHKEIKKHIEKRP